MKTTSITHRCDICQTQVTDTYREIDTIPKGDGLPPRWIKLITGSATVSPFTLCANCWPKIEPCTIDGKIAFMYESFHDPTIKTKHPL